MVLRPHWGKAGAALISIAIVSALGDVIAVTTTTRSHVPLWPLVICAAVFILGCILFACRLKENSVTLTAHDEIAPPTYPNREFSDTGPEEIMKVLKENTGIQADKLLRPYYGKWMRFSGPLADVSPWTPYAKFATVSLSNYSVSTTNVIFYFQNRNVVEGRLAVLRPGTQLTIKGEISDIDPLWIQLNRCEIESVSLNAKAPK